MGAYEAVPLQLRLEEGDAGVPILTLVDVDGSALGAVCIARPDAGGLGAQLLSAAHRPLQHPYLVDVVRMPLIDDLPRIDPDDRDEDPDPSAEVRISPSSMPARRIPEDAGERTSTVVWSSHLPVEETPEWQFAVSARNNMRKNKVTEDEVLLVLEEPAAVAPAQRGHGTTYSRRGIGVVVAPDAPLVIAVYREDPPGASQRPKGGIGRRMPSTFRELSQQLTAHGFTVSSSGSGHPRAMHPLLGSEHITLASTPSDPRSYSNAIALIKQRTGIDITTEPSR